jgi:NAD(P)-dependent dehydrogenase (short-subunit alcohol dehydrogenase family)
MALVADVLNQSQLEDARQQVMNHWGRIDILLNVAGGNLTGATIGPDQNFFDLSIDDFDSVVALNLKGTVLPTYVFAQEMARQGQGSILNISSMTAQQPFTRVVGYAAAKAAIDNFTKWLAVEMAVKYGEKIRVNAIAPGVFIGDQNRTLLLDEHNQLTARGNTIIGQTPMKRFGEPEELAGTVIWLCSPAASFITGIVVPVDGGFSAFSGV